MQGSWRFWTRPTFSLVSRSGMSRIQTEIPPWYRHRLPWQNFDEMIEYGYQTYELARQNRLNSLVLGHGRLFEDRILTSNFGTTNIKLLKAASHTPKEVQGMGSVLADAYWVPYLNDSWAFGGIHSGSTFYTGESSLDFPLDRLWDESAKRPTVFGRELVLLDISGYGMADLKWADLVGVTLVPGSWSDRANVGFTDLYKWLDQVRDKKDFEAILKSLRKRRS